MNHLAYYEGYCKALIDLHIVLSKWEPSFRADRKRNNIKNITWLLECILENPDIFATFGAETPIYFRTEGKRLRYYIKKDDWPLNIMQPVATPARKESLN